MEQARQITIPAVTPHQTTETGNASEYLKALVKIVNEFHAGLDQHEEVGMRLVSFGQAVTFHVEAIDYFNPNLIRFYGRLKDGSAVELVQHISQINFLLMAVNRPNPEEPKKPIGFFPPIEEEVTEASE